MEVRRVSSEPAMCLTQGPGRGAQSRHTDPAWASPRGPARLETFIGEIPVAAKTKNRRWAAQTQAFIVSVSGSWSQARRGVAGLFPPEALSEGPPPLSRFCSCCSPQGPWLADAMHHGVWVFRATRCSPIV